MKRALYIALLINFIVLLGTGVARFLIPFDIFLSRLHIFSGLIVGLLTIVHLIDKIRQLKEKFWPRRRAHPWLLTLLVVVGCCGFWMAVWYHIPGVSHVMALSYEQRNHAAIFRSQGNVAHQHKDDILRTKKLSSTGASLDLILTWSQVPEEAAVAIWAETKSGTIIETLYLSGSLQYAEQLPWEGKLQRRGKVLPVWRHRYTSVCGVDPHGDTDLLSRPTINHQWLLDQKLDESREGFVIYVEVNLPDDDTPSLIYAANIEPDAVNSYALLDLLGHSDGSENDGELNYDLSILPHDASPVERIMVKTQWGKPATSPPSTEEQNP